MWSVEHIEFIVSSILQVTNFVEKGLWGVEHIEFIVSSILQVTNFVEKGLWGVEHIEFIVSSILQVTNFVEKGRRKCEEYWSDSQPQTYGNFTVQCLGVVSFPDYKVRKLSVVQVRGVNPPFLRSRKIVY